jgi:hypothetical protein
MNAALERTMKIQEVILRALAKKITWWQAAEIIGITDRPMRRMAWRYSPLANLQQRVCLHGGQSVRGRW